MTMHTRIDTKSTKKLHLKVDKSSLWILMLRVIFFYIFYIFHIKNSIYQPETDEANPILKAINKSVF